MASHVAIGCSVSIKFQDQSIRVFEITDSSQRVAPEKGIISRESPLGRAVIGRAAGERVSYRVNSQQISAEVVEINEVYEKIVQ